MTRMLLELLSGKPSTCLAFKKIPCKLKTLHPCDPSKVRQFFPEMLCLILVHSTLLAKTGQKCWKTMHTRMKRILTISEVCEESDIENRKLGRTAWSDFFFFF